MNGEVKEIESILSLLIEYLIPGCLDWCFPNET